jgi:hypothetical protein
MSIRLIAKELYAARQREETLAREVADARGAHKSRLETTLRQARAERRRLEEILAGHIDRGPARR